MRANRQLEGRHAATELPARACGKPAVPALGARAEDRQPKPRWPEPRVRAERGHGVLERGAHLEAWPECPILAERVVPIITLPFAADPPAA
jgi:hypothetical protein